MDPKWVAATSASLREIMRGLEIADPGLKRRIAREEDARSEAADRATAQALRGAAAEQPQRNACMGRNPRAVQRAVRGRPLLRKRLRGRQQLAVQPLTPAAPPRA